eukprot:scaffold6188_cov192-Chaetoceros_neogracile.AAC.2
MISSYSLLAAALAVIASHTTPAVASSFVSNQLIGDHIVKRTLLEEGDDPFFMMSAECKSETVSARLEIEKERVAGNVSYSCKDAGGKDIKVEFEGTCPFSTAGEGFGDSDCVGTSCTVKEFQAFFDAMVTGGQSSYYEGCSNFKVSSLDDYQDDTPLEEEGDDLQLISVECDSEIDIVQARIEEEFAAGNLSYSCKDAGGKVFKLEFEGTCPAYSSSDEDGIFIDVSDPNCVGTSCTVKEFQARIDFLLVTADQQTSASVEGCSNFKISSPEESSGAFSLGTAGCIMASLLLSTAALLN